jgi:hypothetical protein
MVLINYKDKERDLEKKNVLKKRNSRKNKKKKNV